MVEQGDPFPVGILNIQSLRFILCVLGFAALVLSNAYKNINVYNLIARRKPVFYQTINELTNDGYKIYSRVTSAKIYFEGESRNVFRTPFGTYNTIESKRARVLWEQYEFFIKSKIEDMTQVYNRAQTTLSRLEMLKDVFSDSIIDENVFGYLQNMSTAIKPILRLGIVPWWANGYGKESKWVNGFLIILKNI